MTRLLLLILLAILISSSPAFSDEKDEYYRNYEEFIRVVRLIQEKYVNEVTLPDLVKSAYRGMLEGLDPYSQFIGPEELEELKIETEGKFGGLGIEVIVKDGLLTIITPIIDTPAFKAGVMVGDRIVKIQGELTENMSLREAIRRLRGDPGTQVTITVIHQGEMEPVDIIIMRDIIHVSSIRGARLLDKEVKIGYVAMSSFQDNTVAEMDKAVNSLLDEGMKSLIFDLRFNPGGLLNVAIDVADRFLQGGVVVSTKGRDTTQNHIYSARAPDTYPNFPLVILVNSGSASAAEIVAGAVKDNKRGLLVGTNTFGKGSVQSLISVEDEHCALKLTTAKYYTPSGKSIHETGIEPDIKVELTQAETKALHEHMARINNVSTKKNGEEAPPEGGDFVDIQLQKAVDVLRGKQLYSELLYSLSNVNPGH